MVYSNEPKRERELIMSNVVGFGQSRNKALSQSIPNGTELDFLETRDERALCDAYTCKESAPWDDESRGAAWQI